MTSGLIGGFHAGVEWLVRFDRLHFDHVGSGKDPLLESIMNAPLIRCCDVAP
jgi:hypothetical protein